MSKYENNPEALAFIQKHKRELSPESYEEESTDPVSTSSIRRNTAPEGPESKSYVEFIGILGVDDQRLYREYLACPVGSAQGLARRNGFRSGKVFLDRMRDLKDRMKRAARRYRVAIAARIPFMPAELVGAATQAEVRLGYGEDSEVVYLVHYADSLTWVDVDGHTFHTDATTVLNNLYEHSSTFEDIDVEVMGRGVPS